MFLIEDNFSLLRNNIGRCRNTGREELTYQIGIIGKHVYRCYTEITSYPEANYKTDTSEDGNSITLGKVTAGTIGVNVGRQAASFTEDVRVLGHELGSPFLGQFPVPGQRAENSRSNISKGQQRSAEVSSLLVQG